MSWSPPAAVDRFSFHPTMTVSRMGVDSRWSVICDPLLVGVSIAVIVIAWWPVPTPRREVRFNTPVAQGRDSPRQYSLALDDPRLALVEKRAARVGVNEPIDSIAIASWRQQVSQHYAVTSGGASAQRWARTAEQSARWLDELHRDYEQQQLSKGAGPILMGTTFQPGPDRRAYAVASLAGLIACATAWYWQRVTPAVQLTQQPFPGRSIEDAAWLDDRTLVLVLPPSWVRVSQPLGVLLRRTGFAVAFLAALASSIA